MEYRTSPGSRPPATRRARVLSALMLLTVAALWFGTKPAPPDLHDHPVETTTPPREVPPSPAPDPSEPEISRHAAPSMLPPTPLSVWAGASLTGRVLSAAGEPVPDAEVLHRTRSAWIPRTPDASEQFIRTGADGRFVISGMATRAHVSLQVRAPGFAATGSSWYGDVTEPEMMDVGDVILDAECVLRGEVRDEQGAPIAGALIRDHGNVLPAEPHVTDEAGHFEIRGVEAYRYSLFAAADGFAAMLPPFPERELRCGETWEGIRFVLSRGVAVRGRVIDDLGQAVAGARVTVVHPYGAFTAGGSIGGQSQPPPQPTDAEGRFSVRGVPGVEGVLIVDADGYVRASRPLPSHPAAPTATAKTMQVGDVVVSPLRWISFRVMDKNGAPTSARPPWLRLRFAPSAVETDDDDSRFAPTGEPGSPRSNKPRHPQFPLAATDTTAAAGPEEHHTPTQETWREESDGFSVLSQYQGTFTVYIPAVSGDFTCGPFETNDDPESEARLITLPYAATAIGTVVDPTGHGVAARVQWVATEKSRVLAQALTDVTGRFELLGAELAAPLSARLVVEPLHHVRRETEITGLRAGEINELPPVVVDDGAEVLIEVVGPDGEPAACADVALWSDGDRVGESVRFEIVETAADGRALVSCLPAGVWRLRVVPEDLWDDHKPPTAAPGWTGTAEAGDAVVPLVGGERAVVRLDARTAGLSQVAGRITIDGVTARGHVIEFTRRDNPHFYPPTTRVRADGTYRSPLLYPREVRVTVLRHGLKEELGAGRITLLPGSTSRLDLDLRPARLSVRVLDGASALVPSEVDIACYVRTPVWWEDLDEEEVNPREFRRIGNLVPGYGTGEDTALSFEDLTPGRWSVVIRHLDATADEEQTVYVTLAPGEDRDLTIRRAYTGAWRVRMATSDGQPWEDLLQELEERGGRAELRATRQDGLRHRFELNLEDALLVDENEIEPGRWDLQLVIIGDGPTRVVGTTSTEVFSGRTAEALILVQD